jgi:hypothetical protein
LTILVLHLNPSFPLTTRAVLPLAVAMGLAYGVNLAAAFYVLIVLRQLTATEVLSPGWVSVRLLSWLCTIAAGAGATIMWLNLRSYGSVLPSDSVPRMTAAAIALSASAVVFLLIALAHVGRRGGRISAALLTVMMAVSIAAPVVARGRAADVALRARPTTPMLGVESARPEGRVIVFAIDGATLDVISPAVAEGRLPNFGRIFDGGAVLHLATLRPTQPEPVWSAAATGRTPVSSGVRASALYRVRTEDPDLELLPDYCFSQALVRFGFLLAQPHTMQSLRARSIWGILSDVGISVGVIGFPLTHPASQVNGYLVSDELHRLTAAALDLEGASAVTPPIFFGEVRAAIEGPASPNPEALVATMVEAPAGDADARPDPSPIVADRMHLQVMDALETHAAPRFLAVRLPGLDAVGHYYLRYADPSAFGDVSEEERRRYGRVLAEYYGFVDTVIGRTLERLGPDDLLLVVSPFGMEPLSPGKRLLEQVVGNARLSGTHERAPDGFLLAYGQSVAASRPPRASVLDFAPTVLYFLGLPVGRDMEGFARTDLFQPSFTALRPIAFIPTYGR